MLEYNAEKSLLPEVLSGHVQKTIQHFNERCSEHADWLQQALTDDTLVEQLYRVWGCSQYCAEYCLRKPEQLCDLIDSGRYLRAYQSEEMSARLQALVVGVESVAALDQQLRVFRGEEMLRIIWRDINRLADMQETTRDVTLLAECTLRQALDFHHQHLASSLGRPMALVNGKATEQRLLILGMGKLGAYELNLSSDIDLIFAYPESGQTDGGDKSVDNQVFFTRVGQRLIQSIDTMNADGFVFRVDMRLRPYGQSGALVLSFDAMEEYYQHQGRDWERYAMIKARVVVGDREQGERLMTLLRPFSYRRYIDFSAIESLRGMKKLIQQEVKRRRLDHDIKLGPGGIREIEFIVQSFQLIRGGRDRSLQERSLLTLLSILEQKEYLPAAVVSALREAYIFLRNSEHVIQAYLDRQTQQLPDAELPCAALFYGMGFTCWDDYWQALEQHREQVRLHFAEAIADDRAPSRHDVVDTSWRHFWLNVHSECECLQLLNSSGYEDSPSTLKHLQQLRDSPALARMQRIGRERLDLFMPLLLQTTVGTEQPSQTLERILPFVEAVLRRTAYLVLLVENPSALKELVGLCATSPWISTQLARHPVLLDELLNASSLYHTPEKAELRDDLQQQVLRLPMDDLEAHMDTLRYFRLAHILKVAACETSGRLPLMKVSDYLTWIAEVILEHVLALAWHNLEARHGQPLRADGSACDKDFIIVGYGKLGGIELGHGSDLDLVFIHNAPVNVATSGERAIENSVFFTRLGQRMIHILTAQTSLGKLYEVDMRLRPSGASGLLVCSLDAFRRYQQEGAWTWEHQALVRARVVAGDPQLALDFDEVRHQQLTIPRDEKILQKDVVEMRQKMRHHLLPKRDQDKENADFAIKQGLGGIVDIEFMVQYAVLAWAQQHPALTRFTDNIRILDTLGREGLFSQEDVLALSNAYTVYRAHAHRFSLQEQKALLTPLALIEHREVVQSKWQALFG